MLEVLGDVGDQLFGRVPSVVFGLADDDVDAHTETQGAADLRGAAPHFGDAFADHRQRFAPEQVDVGLFGAGSVAGMALMSLALGAPLMIAGRRAAWLYGTFRAAAGIGSLAFGLFLAWEIGMARGLFG